MSDFDFYHFLAENGYQKETIREVNGQIFCTNYLKELEENTWNSLTVHKDITITGASPKSGIAFNQIPQPNTKEDADLLLKQIEDF